MGFDTARIVAHPHALPSTNTTSDIIDLFNCSAGNGVAAPYPSNRYDVYVEIVNTNGTATYATSVPTFIDLTTADKDATFDIHTDKGYFFLDWALFGRSSAAPLASRRYPRGAAVTSLTSFATITLWPTLSSWRVTLPRLAA